MVDQWKILFPTQNGPDPRTVYVYLPESYHESDETRYPVLYMFDGHNVFFDSDATYGKSWGLSEYMDYTETQLMVVAVECNRDNHNGRLKEYSPYPFPTLDGELIEGHGKETMDWWVNVLKPLIDKRYRTLSERQHTYIAGSSMGGLMSLYAILEYNHVFSRAAALSPSIWTNAEQLKALVKESHPDADTVIYMDYGSREMKFHKDMRRQFERMTQQLLKKRVFLMSRIVPYGDHCESCWEKQLPFVMHTMVYEP